MERGLKVFSSETSFTFVHKSDAIIEVLGNVLQLDDGNAILTPEGGGLILDSENKFMQTDKQGYMPLYIVVLRPQYFQQVVEGRVKEIA